MRSPLRWPGGKRLLAETILAFAPSHRTYVETCCGGAAVFWAKPRELSKAEILNDADGELVNFYHLLHKHGRKLAAEVDSMPYSRALFVQVLRSRPRGSFRRAARFWYLNRVAFGAKRRGPSFGVKASARANVIPNRVLQDLDATIERLRGVLFESVDVQRLIELYDRPATFFYVDPPFLGLSQDYACRFSQADHDRLAKVLGETKGAWLLSYNDCRDVRALYRGRFIRRLASRYTIGCNSASGGSSVARELLISNRPLRRAQHK